ncbi:hypothetical protein PoB_001157100 [Plakobranchus ocellatus]|uniref:Uncharacterized protein n=1 Tax=Plakobranchus ocellatus TaxID=259542 RepID=A0AAV3YP48_9GAST|nr:hypothetical protein PoB_001157100 [Plakobranchus ocellatus]
MAGQLTAQPVTEYTADVLICSLCITSNNKMISSCQVLRQTRAPWRGSNPRQKSPCRSQNWFGIQSAADVPTTGVSVDRDSYDKCISGADLLFQKTRSRR